MPKQLKKHWINDLYRPRFSRANFVFWQVAKPKGGIFTGNFAEITSKDNKFIKLVTKLQKSTKARKEEKKFVLEGLRICLDAFENGISFYAVIYTKEFFSKNKEFCEKLSNKSLNTLITTENLFAKISETVNPQGVIAVANIPAFSGSFKKSGRFVALENINDPANLGAIARTSEALGIDGIVVTSDTADPYSPKALRASMGTLIRMPIFICDDLSEFIIKHNLRSFACVVDADAENIAEIKFADGDVIIIGNEANGITDKTKKEAYKNITIKMKGNAESLNAAAAASIAIFSLTK